MQAPGPADVSETPDLGTMTRELCAEISTSILSRDIDFELIKSGAVLPVDGERVFICEAVLNLIHNATQHGGPLLPSIRVALGEDDGNARVTVRDDGVVLLPANRDAAFGRFSQITPSSSSGLGLAITVSVADGMAAGSRSNRPKSAPGHRCLSPCLCEGICRHESLFVAPRGTRPRGSQWQLEASGRPVALRPRAPGREP